MGGLVVKKVCSLTCLSLKQAIIDAIKNSNYAQRVFPYMKGILFISTPHRVKDFTTLLTAVWKTTEERVKDLLRISGPKITEINETFEEYVNKQRKVTLNLSSFYEDFKDGAVRHF